MTPERRIVEFRASQDGRSVSGTAIDYRDRSPSHRERFRPGAFRDLPASLPLNLLHDGEVEVGTAYLADGPERLEFRAEVGKRAVAQMITDAYLRGASIEFRAHRESRDPDMTRVVEQASLTGLALVREPSYPKSRIEVRARSGRTLRARIPVDTDVACECAGGGCTHANFQAEALGEMWGDVFREGTKRIAAAYLNSYAQPIASTSRGTLRGRIVGVNGFQVDMDIPDSQAGRDLIAAWESSGIVVRPFIRDMQGDVVDGVRHVTGGRLAAFIVTATDAREGWPDPEFVPTPGMDGERVAPERRRRLWL